MGEGSRKRVRERMGRRLVWTGCVRMAGFSVDLGFDWFRYAEFAFCALGVCFLACR